MTVIKDLWQFLWSLMDRMDKIHLSLIAAGVGFYGMFAVFPGLTAIFALWGLWYDPLVIQQYSHIADEFIPGGASTILHDQVDALVTSGRTQLGWTTAISFVVATVAARAGVDALVRGLNAAHGVRSHSTIFGFLLAYVLTLALVGVVLLGMATIVIGPLAINFLTEGPLQSWLISIVPWSGMFLIVLLAIGILYRYGPNVKAPRTPIFTWGSLIAALVWAAASFGFSLYLGSFNSYNRIYGSIGAVIALLMWFYLGGFSVLLGALINVEMSRRRRINIARKARANSAKAPHEQG